MDSFTVSFFHHVVASSLILHVMPLKSRIDLRSDTFTEPTAAIREAMETCPVGDDVWELDPTVKQLEDVAAKLFGKQSALSRQRIDDGWRACKNTHEF